MLKAVILIVSMSAIVLASCVYVGRHERHEARVEFFYGNHALMLKAKEGDKDAVALLNAIEAYSDKNSDKPFVQDWYASTAHWWRDDKAQMPATIGMSH